MASGRSRSLGPLPGRLLVDIAPDRHVLAQRLAHRLALDCPAPEGDDGRCSADLAGERIQRGYHQPFLPAPELDLALALEEGGNRLAELAFEQLVGVDDAEPEPCGDRLGGPGLARRHEPDQNDSVVGVLLGYLRHPIRSL